MVNSADDKLMIFFLFFPLENMIRHFMQIVSKRDNLHKVLFSGKNNNKKTNKQTTKKEKKKKKKKKKFQYVVCCKILPSMLSVNGPNH